MTRTALACFAITITYGIWLNAKFSRPVITPAVIHRHVTLSGSNWSLDGAALTDGTLVIRNATNWRIVNCTFTNVHLRVGNFNMFGVVSNTHFQTWKD